MCGTARPARRAARGERVGNTQAAADTEHARSIGVRGSSIQISRRSEGGCSVKAAAASKAAAALKAAAAKAAAPGAAAGGVAGPGAPQIERVPVGAVHTGDGSSIPRAGSVPPVVAIGIATLGLAVAGAGVTASNLAHRRRRQR